MHRCLYPCADLSCLHCGGPQLGLKVLDLNTEGFLKMPGTQKPLHQVSVGCNLPLDVFSEGTYFLLISAWKERMGLSFAAVVRFESPTVSADDQDRFRGLALSVAKNLRISSSVLRSWTPASSPSNAVSAT